MQHFPVRGGQRTDCIFQGIGKEILFAVVLIFLQLRYLIFYMAIVIVTNAVNYRKGKILIQNFP
jgi:cell division protein FtsW (lipid II flippase)